MGLGFGCMGMYINHFSSLWAHSCNTKLKDLLLLAPIIVPSSHSVVAFACFLTYFPLHVYGYASPSTMLTFLGNAFERTISWIYLSNLMRGSQEGILQQKQHHERCCK